MSMVWPSTDGRPAAAAGTSTAEKDPAWGEFIRATTDQVADRNRWLAAIGGVFVILYSAFDLTIDPISPAVLRTRMLTNGGLLLAMGGLIIALSSRRLRRHVFAILFGFCAMVLVVEAYSLGIASPSPGRLVFHYLTILGLTLTVSQWLWPWQLLLGIEAFVLFVAVAPSDHPDAGFYTLGLGIAAVSLAAAANALSRWRYHQFCVEAELRRANRVKSEFLSTMSHELRTPINVIVGYSDLLHEGAMGPLTEDQEQVVSHVARAGRHLLGLVENTLNVSRLESGRMGVDIRPFELHELVEELRASVSLLCVAYHTVPVHWHVPAARLYVESDQLKLKEIVLNLVGNAIKFTDEGDVRVEIDLDAHNRLCLRVKDSGLGIPAERLPTIFDSFEQLHRSRPTPQPGVGLGLYIVKKLVDLLGGQIEVDSVVGEGSEFRVRIPVRVLQGFEPRRAPVAARPAAAIADAALSQPCPIGQGN